MLRSKVRLGEVAHPWALLLSSLPSAMLELEGFRRVWGLGSINLEDLRVRLGGMKTSDSRISDIGFGFKVERTQVSAGFFSRASVP